MLNVNIQELTQCGTTINGCLHSMLPSKENCPIAELITIVEDRKASSGSPLLQISEIAASSRYRAPEEKRIASIATDEMLEIDNFLERNYQSHLEANALDESVADTRHLIVWRQENQSDLISSLYIHKSFDTGEYQHF